MTRYRRWPNYQAWRHSWHAKHDIGLIGSVHRNARAKAREIFDDALRAGGMDPESFGPFFYPPQSAGAFP